MEKCFITSQNWELESGHPGAESPKTRLCITISSAHSKEAKGSNQEEGQPDHQEGLHLYTPNCNVKKEKKEHFFEPPFNTCNSTRSYWLWTLYSFNYFDSELSYRDGPYIRNVSFVEMRKKYYIFKTGE